MTQKFEMFMNQMHGNRTHTEHFSRIKTENLPIVKEFSGNFRSRAKNANVKIVDDEFSILKLNNKH